MSNREGFISLGRGVCLLRAVEIRKSGNYGTDVTMFPTTWCGKHGREALGLLIATTRKDADCRECLEMRSVRDENTEDIVHHKKNKPASPYTTNNYNPVVVGPVKLKPTP